MDFLAVSTALEIVSLHLKNPFEITQIQVPFHQIKVTFSPIELESGFRQNKFPDSDKMALKSLNILRP